MLLKLVVMLLGLEVHERRGRPMPPPLRADLKSTEQGPAAVLAVPSVACERCRPSHCIYTLLLLHTPLLHIYIAIYVCIHT